MRRDDVGHETCDARRDDSCVRTAVVDEFVAQPSGLWRATKNHTFAIKWATKFWVLLLKLV